MGEIAARTLVDRIEGRLKEAPEVAVEQELVVRRCERAISAARIFLENLSYSRPPDHYGLLSAAAVVPSVRSCLGRLSFRVR